MAYRKTRRSKEVLARMRAGKDAARMDRPAAERKLELPDLRRRITVETFDFGYEVHVMEFYKTNRVDCFRVVADGALWKLRIGWAKALAGLRMSIPRVGSN